MAKQTRKTSTVADIQTALIQLINEKGLPNLNVTDLTRAAGIGRGTFYTHYTDKADLVEQVETDLLKRLQADLAHIMPDAMKWLISSTAEPAPFITETLNNFYENQRLIAALLSEQGDPYFLNRIKQVVFADLDTAMVQLGDQFQSRSDLPADYVREFIIDEIMGVILYWIKKPQPEQPAEVAQIITQLQRTAPAQLLRKTKEKGGTKDE
ncbi:TetR/AcrR family transcriptional regulator [Fructilactobacillus myrtifloralis]|uniref:TetR/AcrR family transcriptional regulator n=1 Tax=Fructilactobacillus myrtifloralis TaxID=2940301 RepID=A0ABY5BMN0_9LACO|nr:TetR/AcrR family transcriptional regulator [Fructilactobacillus myrtifloralis]USS84754.1 TetR/AcrR family transcriptional regulator [Fructilactobacillus myrtifloralis]